MTVSGPSIPRGKRNTLLAFTSWLLVLGIVLAGCGGGEGNPAVAEQAATGPVSSASAQPPARVAAPPARSVDAVKITVNQAGLYNVTAEQLQAAGFDLQAHEPQQLMLTMAGEPVAWTLEDSDQGPLRIVFYGQPRQSRYGRDNVYWLRWAERAAASPAEAASRLVAPGQSSPVTAFDAQLRLEESVFYMSQTPQDTDHWLWQRIFAPDSITVSFDLPAWAGGDAALNVSFWADTRGAQNPDHHVILRVNGQEAADLSWDDRGWQSIAADAPAAALRATGNELVIEAPGDTGAVVDVVYLDKVEIGYSRQLAAAENRLEFSAPAGETIVVTGFDGDDLTLWDVTEPQAAQSLSGFQVADGQDGYALSFRDVAASGQRRYAVAGRSSRLTPAAVTPASSRDLRDNPIGADYIIVTHGDFVAALQPLLDFRRSQGLRVTVATINDVYDSFSDGLLDPAAIRRYMRYAWDNWTAPAPRFLLLVGDASYDYQGFLPGSTPNYTPTYLLSTHFVGETASDNWFVSLNEDDDRPSMAVGRIPAQTAAQVATVVAKTLAYERSSDAEDWVGRALFVADDKQQSFQAMTDDLADAYLPASYAVERVYLGQTADASAEILASLRQGVGLVTYVGHGSMNVWAQEKIFRVEDVATLGNRALPFMMTMTCLVGYFHHPQASSMGEELLFKQGGGVVAAFVPTSESLASDQRKLAENVYTHLFDLDETPTIGEAIMAAKQDLPSERDAMQDLIETFTLLGDPALILRRPPG